VDHKLDWPLRAIADLREIATYIGQDNPTAALAWGDDLFRHIEVLMSFPMIGTAVAQTTFLFVRRLVFGDYLIYYRVKLEPKRVEILTVWHAARGFPDFL
jgi:plasmid stabilization system protein ParE